LPAVVLVGVLLLGAPAARAVITVRANGSTTSPFRFGKAQCDNNIAVAFTFDLGTDFVGQTVSLRATDKADCTTGTNDKTYTYPTATNSISINVQDFLLRSPNGCSTASTSATPGVAYLCVSFPVTSLATTQTQFNAFPVNYALQPPAAPIGLTAQPGDSHLRLNWSPGNPADSIATYDVFAVLSGRTLAAGEKPTQSVSTATADVQRTDDGATLQNGVSYDLAVRATDTYFNTSAISAPIAATPVQIDDFYNRYRNAGGQAAGGGGCAAGGEAGLLGGLVLLAFAAVRRRREWGKIARRSWGRAGSASLLLSLGLLGAPQAARAQLTNLGVPQEEPPERRLLFGLKIDRYNPQIDSQPGLTGTPYQDIFRGRVPLRWQLEVDWEAWHPFGSILFGGTVGFWQNIGRGIIHSSGVRSDDTALLDIVPFSAVATYRFDWVADRVRWLPIIPYAQVGLAAALWTSFAGNGNVSRGTGPAGGRGSGWTYGYTTALGFALSLDAISPDLSNEGRREIGLKRTSLFAEYGWTRLDDFHSGGALILSDRAWRFGLSLEF
jgi:MYXO-CTERM domain-containing protein